MGKASNYDWREIMAAVRCGEVVMLSPPRGIRGVAGYARQFMRRHGLNAHTHTDMECGIILVWIGKRELPRGHY